MMWNILHPSTAKSKLPMNYTYPPSALSCTHNKGVRGYRPRQAQQLCEVRSGNSRNALRIATAVWAAAKAELLLQHSPEQVAARLPVSHETL